MRNQEQERLAPDMISGDRRPINTDPREQPQREGWQFGGAVAPAPRQKRNPWYWMIVGVVILVVIFGGLSVAGLLLSRTVTETRTFSVSAQPALVLTEGNGSVHLQSGPAGQITVVAHKHIFAGNTDQVAIHYTLSGDDKTLTVSTDDGNNGLINLFSWNVGVDFDVTAPGATNLNVKTGNGSVESHGITGQMQLSSGNGSISTDGGSGQITLTAGNGSIQATGVNGLMTIQAGNGSVTVLNARASGASTFHSGNGSITFSGSLDANNGNYLFDTGNGSIDLTLPAATSMRLHSSIGNGSFTSDFPGVPSLQNGGILDIAVGSAPFALVTLHDGNGSIQLYQGG